MTEENKALRKLLKGSGLGHVKLDNSIEPTIHPYLLKIEENLSKKKVDYLTIDDSINILNTEFGTFRLLINSIVIPTTEGVSVLMPPMLDRDIEGKIESIAETLDLIIPEEINYKIVIIL